MASQPWVVRALLVAIAAFLVLHKAASAAAWVVTVAVVDAVAWGVLKQVVHRPRPDALDQIAGWSFPSGHATEIAAATGCSSS